MQAFFSSCHMYDFPSFFPSALDCRITQNAFTLWHPWGLLSLLSRNREREGSREEKRGQSRDYEKCMWVCVCASQCVCVGGVHVMFVCACRREKTSTWPADRAVFFKYSKKKEKENPAGHISTLKQAPSCICRQTKFPRKCRLIMLDDIKTTNLNQIRRIFIPKLKTSALMLR